MTERSRTLVDLIVSAPEEGELLQLLHDVAEAQEDDDRELAETALRGYSATLALKQKVDAYSHLMAFFAAQQLSTKTEIERLQRRLRHWERAANGLERHAMFALSLVEPDRHGRQKLEGNSTTLTLRANPPAVDLHGDWTQVPEEFVRVTVTMPLLSWRELRDGHLIGGHAIPTDKIEYSVPKDPIKQALLAGREIKGASLSQSMRVSRT